MTDNIFDKILVKFEQFLLLVGNVLAHEKEIHLIQNKIRRHFNTTSSSYLCSTDFELSLNHIYEVFNKNDKSTKYFTLLNLFDGQLKKHSIKLSKSNETVKSISSTEETIDQSSISNSIKSLSNIVDKSSNLCDHILTLNESPKIIQNSNNISDNEIKQKKKINKLERRLTNLSKIIRELEEKELSLDEMKYSDLYVVESNLKKQAYEIFIKLAELKNQPLSAERVLDQPVTLTENETDHPFINKALENMVNQTRFLPSFDEVLDTVDKTNDKYQLKLSIDVRKNLAEKSFKLIGAKIKDRRMADFNDIMKSRLPEDFDIEQNDPAFNSVEIEKTLLENEREAITKTEKILETFSQIDASQEPEINIGSSDESSVESDDDDEEEEEENDNEDKGEKQDDKAYSESKTAVKPFDHEPDEYQYDVVDMLPPFSPKFSSSSPSTIIEQLNSKDPVEVTTEVPLVNDCTSRISRINSIPLKRAARNPFIAINESEIDIADDDDIQESQSMPIIQKDTVHTVIPRRRQQQQQQSIFNQRMTNSDFSIAQKRLLELIDSSNCKKRKEESAIIILD